MEYEGKQDELGERGPDNHGVRDVEPELICCALSREQTKKDRTDGCQENEKYCDHDVVTGVPEYPTLSRKQLGQDAVRGGRQGSHEGTKAFSGEHRQAQARGKPVSGRQHQDKIGHQRSSERSKYDSVNVVHDFFFGLSVVEEHRPFVLNQMAG